MKAVACMPVICDKIIYITVMSSLVPTPISLEDKVDLPASYEGNNSKYGGSVPQFAPLHSSIFETRTNLREL